MKIFDQNIHNTMINPANIRFRADAQINNLPVYEEEIELPDMYYMPENYKKEKTVLDVVKNFDLFGIIKAWTEHPLLMVGTCAGMSMFIDAFDKSCSKEYEKSIVGKAAKFGDNIEQSKFIQNETSQKALSGIKKGWKKVKTTAMKNDVINSMFTTPSKPEWAAPKDELKHTNYRIVNKFKELVSIMDMIPVERGIEDYPRRTYSIKDLALDKDEIEELKTFYKVDKLSQAPQEEVPYRVMLKRLGKSEQEIADILSGSNPAKNVSEELFKKSGLTKAEFEAIMQDETGETIELVKKASENLKGTKIVKGKYVLPGPRQPFANIESFEGIYNRVHSLTDGAKTKTGRFMSKLVQKIHRGFTWGNAKTGVMLLVAPIFMEAILNTHKAEKNEKIGTAVSGLINAVSWVFTFPIALRMIHAFGGIQYAGMGKEKVEEYEKLIKEFNAKTELDNPEHFKSLSEYRDAKRKLKGRLKDMRKVKNQNFLTGTLRGISKFSKADLLKLESYKCGEMAQDTLRKLPNLIKDYLIYAPGRMIVFMLVGVGLVDKVINKILSKIFGTAYDGMKDEDMKTEKQKQEENSINALRTRLVEIERNKLNPHEAVELNNTVKSNSIKQQLPESMLELAMLNNKSLDEGISKGTNVVEPEDVVEIKTDNSQDNFAVENNIADYSGNHEQITPDVTEPINLLPIATDKKMPEISEPVVENITEPINLLPIATDDKMPEISEPIVENITEPENTEPVNLNNTEPESLSILPAPINNIDNTATKPISQVKNHDNYTYIPSSENLLGKDVPTMQTNKYVPSQTGIKINKSFDNSALESAIRRSNRAEARALRILSGNFDDMV